MRLFFLSAGTCCVLYHVAILQVVVVHHGELPVDHHGGQVVVRGRLQVRIFLP